MKEFLTIIMALFANLLVFSIFYAIFTVVGVNVLEGRIRKRLGHMWKLNQDELAQTFKANIAEARLALILSFPVGLMLMLDSYVFPNYWVVFVGIYLIMQLGLGLCLAINIILDLRDRVEKKWQLDIRSRQDQIRRERDEASKKLEEIEQEEFFKAWQELNLSEEKAKELSESIACKKASCKARLKELENQLKELEKQLEFIA